MLNIMVLVRYFHIYSLEYIVNNIKYLEINYSPDNETNAIITNIGWSMRLSFINTNNLIYISTRNELKNISGFANYKLVNDIDLLEIPWEPLDIQYFTFNGNGKTIKGLNIIQDTFIETSEQNKFYGLFGYIENSATIYDLTLEGNIEVDENSENYFTDIRVGLLLGDGYNIVLENINVIGTINANGDAFRVGLVFGNIGNGSINNLESSGSINIIGINSSMIGSIGGYISFTNINSSILKSSSDITFSWFKQFSWETNPIWINEIIGNIFAYSGYPLENFSFNGTLEIIEMTSS